MLKKTICIMLSLLIFMLAGCSNRSAVPTPPTEQPVDWMTKKPFRSVTIPLYFLSLDGKRLVVEMRDVEIASEESIASAAIQELIKGPTDSKLQPVLPNIFLDGIQTSGEVANIQLSAGYEELFPVEMISARAAIVNTLTAITDIKYVNVYTDSREPGYGGKPLGTMERLSGELSLYVDQTRQALDQSIDYLPDSHDTILTTLYFADFSNQFLSAEVRKVEYSGASYVKTLMNELFSGPHDASRLPVLEGIALQDDPTFSIVANGKSTVTVNLTSEPKNASLAYAAIVDTITGFVPEVQYVSIKINGTLVEEVANAGAFSDGLMRSDLFAPLMGDDVTLYFPAKSELSLIPTRRVIPAEQSNKPLVLVRELMKGPASGEGGAIQGAFAAGFVPQDVLGVTLFEQTAIVNLSPSFGGRCSALTDEEIYLLMYSIVDTLTSINGIKQVQFLQDGAVIDSVGGSLALNRPLMRNVGVIAT